MGDIKPQNKDLDIADNVRKIMDSPTYRRADRDLDFLSKDELRSYRLQLEFLKPELQLEETGICHTIVVIGGARFVESKIAQHDVDMNRKALQDDPDNQDLKHKLAVVERILAKSHYYEIARQLGQVVGQSGQGALDHRLVVVTGGGPGIMEAANRGAYEVGAKSVGLNITLPREQLPNPYVTPELCFQFRYFALRKMHFMLRAKALVVFPGGYGTLDELFDVLCLVQTDKVDPLPIILVGEEYWRHVFDVQYLVDEGAIAQEDVNLFMYAETADQIWNSIVEWYEQAGLPLFS